LEKENDSDSDSASERGSDVADDDMAAARATLSMAKEKKSWNENEENDGVYRAPRLTAVPYAHDQEGKNKEKEKRTKRRMRATELAQTLRAQYGDAPEQEDIHGGSDYGKQREAARRMAEREAEKTRYEEDSMVRLTTSRKEKKERKQQMRQESSNLSAISDLGNLVRETRAFGRNDESEDEATPEPPMERERYDNGKRRRDQENVDGKPMRQDGKSKGSKPKNSLQGALFSTGGTQNKKKSRR
jgi:hypothetical protein